VPPVLGLIVSEYSSLLFNSSLLSNLELDVASNYGLGLAVGLGLGL